MYRGSASDSLNQVDLLTGSSGRWSWLRYFFLVPLFVSPMLVGRDYLGKLNRAVNVGTGAFGGVPELVTVRWAIAMYEVVVTNRIRMQLRDAPPVLLGDVAGIIAVLRVDPTTASSVFQIRQVDDEAWIATFGAGRGFLTYWVVEDERMVVLLDLAWAG